MEKLKGVNLGNWLVLEKWMHPDLFFGIPAEDELDFATMLDDQEKQTRYRLHRDSYISERDFAAIAGYGLNSVRIPVPHFIFGDAEPYVGCIDYLDQAFVWAEKYGLSVLIDLHTVPDSQNGFDNGGICGVCKWHQKSANIDRTLDILEELAKRYYQHTSLYGIELLNEPISKELWDFLVSANRYPPRDPAMAQGSDYVPSDILRDFYLRGYDRLRRYLTNDQTIVIHDGFRLNEWKDFMREDHYHNVVLDTHYYFMGQPELESAGIDRYVAHVSQKVETDIAEMSQYFDLIVGEWCISNQVGGLSQMNETERSRIYRMISDAQKKAWQHGIGWYFWNYKLLADRPGWDFAKCHDQGWIDVR